MRLNVKQGPALQTHEGAPAKHIDAVAQLRRSVLACLLFEDQFYEDGKSIADRIQDEVRAVLAHKNGADIVAQIALEARSQYKLRHAPLWLALALVEAATSDARKVVAPLLTGVIQRADELGEFLAMYWKDKKRPLPNQVKKGLASAFKKFDAYSLAKNDHVSAAVRIRDVMFLTHPSPLDEKQAETWRKLANKQLESPDTWEVALSAGADKKEAFERLITEHKLGPLALLRNLRNMTQAGVDIALIRECIRTMNVERILPFRFISAARYAPTLEPELEQAMFKCLASVERLPGSTVLCVDTSGSMSSTVSEKSEISRRDAACALAILLREICENCQVVAFGSTAGLVPPRRGFGLNDAIGNGKFGHGTDIAAAITVAQAINPLDRLIVLTDEQSATRVGNPLKHVKGYMVNVASYKNGIGYGDWVHLDGWSEAIVDYIQQFEKL